MLLGLATLAVPIVIHLRARSRSITVDWPTLRFLRTAQHRTAQRSRLKHILVLLMRLALLTLLVLAMAKPYRHREHWTRPADWPTTLVIVLDNSYSMGYRETGASKSRFDRAKVVVLAMIADLGLADEVALVLANDEAITLIDRPTRDHERVADLVHQSQLSSRSTDLRPALDVAFGLAQLDAEDEDQATETGNDRRVVRQCRRAWRQVLLLTDLQRLAWRNVLNEPSDRSRKQLPLTVVNLARGPSPNRYVRRSQVESFAVGGETRISIEIGQHGPRLEDLAPAHVGLWINDQQVGSSELVGMNRRIKLSARTLTPGTHLVEVRIDEDRLVVDDRAHVAVHVPDTGRVTVVSGDPSQIRHRAETFYLETALNTASSRGRANALAVDHRSPQELSQSPIHHDGCLVLANVGRLDGAALVNVENFLHSGGSALITLGHRVEIDHYNQDWPFLPALLGPLLGDPGQSRAYEIDVQQPDHPVLQGLDLSTTRFFAFFGVNPTTLFPEAGAGASILALFSNGSPALIESNPGSAPGTSTRTQSPIGAVSPGGGRVILLTSTIDADWSNLPHRRVFVPLVDRLVSYLTRRHPTSRQVSLGQSVRFTGPRTIDRYPITVVAPDRTRQSLTAVLDPQTNQATADFRDTHQIGLYRVEADARFANAKAFAVNLDTQESNLQSVDFESVRAAFPDRPVRLVADQPDLRSWHLTQEGTLSEKRQTYWPWLLLGALLLFVVETLLANLFTRRRQVAPPPSTQYVAMRRTEGVTSSFDF